jgi:hypothetical protein
MDRMGNDVLIMLPRLPKSLGMNYCASGMTKNEINNLIYMFLRYAFMFDGRWHQEVDNQEIAEIMISVGSDVTQKRLVDETVKFVVAHHDLGYLLKYYHKTVEDVIVVMNTIYNDFLMLPDRLKNDLGEDTGANDFLDKN